MYAGWGAGSQSPRSDIYVKLEFSAMLIPILASASLRQLPWDSVGFRRPRATISSCNVGIQTSMYLGGMPGANLPCPIFHIVEFPSGACLISDPRRRRAWLILGYADSSGFAYRNIAIRSTRRTSGGEKRRSAPLLLVKRPFYGPIGS